MNRFSWLATATTVVVVGVVAYILLDPSCQFGAEDCDPPPISGAEATATAAAELTVDSGLINISIASSITKTELVENAVAAFNAESARDPSFQVNGVPIRVEILKETDDISGVERHWNSASITNQTLDGDIQPTIVSPATQTWVLKLNKGWDSLHGYEIATGPFESLLSTPVTVAMWRSRAEVLGCWPEAGPECTWSALRELAVSPDGWGSVGRPSWGKFHLGYARVGASDVATQTVALICMAGLDKYEGLEIEDVSVGNDCGQAIADVDRAITHRGTSSPLLIHAMLQGGPSFLDAVTTYEKNVLQVVAEDTRPDPLVTVFPADGVVVADHVFAVLDKAPWVTSEQVSAARVFERFLLSDSQQSLVADNFLRPARQDHQSSFNVLDVPDVEILDQVIEIWKQVKKPANIVLVFDQSGSMNDVASPDGTESKISQATAGAVSFVDAMDRNDWLAWLPFNDELFLGATGKKGLIGEDLVNEIFATKADGGTALYDAIARAHELLQTRRDELGDEERYGIVVLSDGKDQSSLANTINNLESLLTPDQEVDPIGIQVHTIGIGADADGIILGEIAGFTNGGQYWSVADGSILEAVYQRISTYF